MQIYPRKQVRGLTKDKYDNNERRGWRRVRTVESPNPIFLWAHLSALDFQAQLCSSSSFIKLTMIWSNLLRLHACSRLYSGFRKKIPKIARTFVWDFSGFSQRFEFPQVRERLERKYYREYHCCHLARGDCGNADISAGMDRCCNNSQRWKWRR